MPIINPTAAGARSRGRAKRRLLLLSVAATAAVGAGALTAGPASAAQTCRSGTQSGFDSVLCLSIDGRTDGRYNVHVGIDVHMPLARAQEYVDDPFDPFTVWIRGDDSGTLKEVLVNVPLTVPSLVATSESGLSADFDKVVTGSQLDEDHGDTDEIKARVVLTDTDTNHQDGEFVSNRIVGNWPF